MPVLENAGDSLNVLTEDGEMRIFTSFLKKSENTIQGAKALPTQVASAQCTIPLTSFGANP